MLWKRCLFFFFLVWTTRNEGFWKRHRYPRSFPDCVVSHTVSFPDSSHSSITDLFPEVNKRHQHRLPVVKECSMENKLALLTLWSSLAAVVHLNSAFYNAATAYTYRSKLLFEQSATMEPSAE